MADDDISYGAYLQLDRLLTSQSPRSDAHDEMLFIIQHQTTELWMRLLLHEIEAARAALIARDFAPTFKMLTRVARIFDQMNLAWDVLRTMTPIEFSSFREVLGTSSGFQSHQYRQIEYALGNRSRGLLKAYEDVPDVLATLEAELARPSLYDVAIDCLAEGTGRAGLKRDTQKGDDPDVLEAWTAVYREPDCFWNLYELAEKLVDLEDYFRRWRFNHVTAVERIIGMKTGTGGTSGVTYLKRILETELFPELWHLRSSL